MNTFQQFLDDMGYEPMSYSGRGMYGKRCLAIQVDRDFSVNKLFIKILEHWVPAEGPRREDLIEAFENVQMDSLGKGMVIYFPGEQYEE